jgi:hypothetical protein
MGIVGMGQIIQPIAGSFFALNQIVILNYYYPHIIFPHFLVGKNVYIRFCLIKSNSGMKFLALAANACDMNEMIEIYHETLLLSLPEPFNNDTKTVERRDIYLKEEIFSVKNSKETIGDQPAKKDSSIMERMELPVNNFLKSLKEIEAEFYFVLNSIKHVIHEIPDSFDTFGRIMKNTETNINLNSTSMELSGYMEENY